MRSASSTTAGPVSGASGNVLAALNVGVHAGRISAPHLIDVSLPVLIDGARELAVLLP
jgi:IclR family pca regulon transcriptional regulator